MRSYVCFQPIDKDCNLARFFNHIMDRLGSMRMLCTPDSFRRDESIADFADEKFCDFCRYEQWMHATVERLLDWSDTIDEYFTEYQGSWKYYAASQRLSALRELDDDGYLMPGNDDGDELKDSDYKDFTILSDLFDDGWKDIVQDTVPDDIKGLCADIVADSRINFLDGLKQTFGDAVQPFRQTEDGTMRPISREEYELNFVAGQVDADDDATRMMAVAAGIHGILHVFRTCRYNDDNTELLRMAADATQAMLDMDFGTLGNVMGMFCEKYDKE